MDHFQIRSCFFFFFFCGTRPNSYEIKIVIDRHVVYQSTNFCIEDLITKHLEIKFSNSRTRLYLPFFLRILPFSNLLQSHWSCPGQVDFSLSQGCSVHYFTVRICHHISTSLNYSQFHDLLMKIAAHYVIHVKLDSRALVGHSFLI